MKQSIGLFLSLMMACAVGGRRWKWWHCGETHTHTHTDIHHDHFGLFQQIQMQEKSDKAKGGFQR